MEQFRDSHFPKTISKRQLNGEEADPENALEEFTYIPVGEDVVNEHC